MELGEFQIYEQDLSALALEEYLQEEAIAVDTETMGLLPWRDRLCLIQLCDSQGRVSVVRIVQGQKDAPNLQRLFEEAGVLKVFHFARFDVATLRHNLSIQTAPVFCTKIASKLARTYAPKHGLKEVVMELAKVELDKSAQSSDWGNAANLSVEQLRYAANDVRYLLDVQLKLTEMLKREGRWELALDCFNCLPTIVSLDLLQYQNLFEH
jgi:ribonuclease D